MPYIYTYNDLLSDVNECDAAPDLCLNGGVCIDGVNSFTCSCVDGYEGITCADGKVISNPGTLCYSLGIILTYTAE